MFSLLGSAAQPAWFQFFITTGATVIVGGAILLILRWALKGAVDAVKHELTSNSGDSVKDKVLDSNIKITEANDKITDTKAEVTQLTQRFDEHLKYQHDEPYGRRRTDRRWRNR
jgi:hypothetical protein